MLFLVFGILSCPAFAEDRIWTSADGKQRVKAAFAGVKGEHIQLLLPNGFQVSLPKSQFSRRDQEFVEQASKSDVPASSPQPESNETDRPVAMNEPPNADTQGTPGDLKLLANDEIGQSSRALAEKHGLSVLHGLPVIHLDHFLRLDSIPSATERSRVYKQAEQALQKEQLNFGKFLELVALGIDAEWIEPFLPSFIANHFPKSVVESLVNFKYQTGGSIGIWKGNNEFEKRAAQERFNREYRSQLTKMAIRTPFRICFLSKAKLSPYDFSRKGLVVAALKKDMSPVAPGDEWKSAFPVLPSAGYYRKEISVAGSPVAGSTFWPVSPEVVKTLPGRTIKGYTGGVRTERWAYIATVVTFHSSPLLEVTERNLPAIFGSVDSINIFAEPTLRTHLYSFPLKRYPSSVLVAGNVHPVAKPESSIPFDEFALAGLIANDKQIEVHAETWKEIWNHAGLQDQEAYLFINEQLKKYFDTSSGFPNMLSSEQTSTQREQQLSDARETLSKLKSNIDQRLHPTRQPFFPPYAGNVGRDWGEQDNTLSTAQQKRLTDWLAERTRVAENRFRLTLKLSLDGRTDEPTLVESRLHPDLAAAFQKQGKEPEHYFSLDENLAFDERGELDLNGTKTGLFRIPGPQFKTYQFLINLGQPGRTLARALPDQIVKQALSQKPGETRIAVFLDVQVHDLKLLDTGFQNEGAGGRPCIVVDVTPTHLAVGKDRQAPLFEVPLDRTSLQKLEASQPQKKIPSQPAGKGQPLELTPQRMLPLIAKVAPEFLDDEEQLDQLMVMRWRFENVSQFDVKPDQIYFFDKGSPSLPSDAERAAKAEEFKAWAQRWAKTIPDQIAVQFKEFSFEGLDRQRPSPALISRSLVPWLKAGLPYNLHHVMYDLQHPDRIQPPMSAEEVQSFLDLFAIAPRDVVLEQQFAVPDTKGNTHKVLTPNNQGIPGLTSVQPAEPIFPVLRFDKEIWSPENPQLAATTQKPKLEVIFQVVSLKLVETLPCQPWIEGESKFHHRNYPADRIPDNGQYALIQVKLKSARLVDPATDKTVLPLVLKEYRSVKKNDAGKN
ncbi:hypothetical protein PM8797T_31248 [Gimesia maris DSM 8797]|nr:hypothetical protein PM8797T_31248 [Gimesia maris DSM 8797]